MKALVLVPIIALAASAALSRPHAAPRGDSTPARFGIGRLATPAEVARLDMDVRPDGHGLPAGSGTPAAGAKIYAAKCVVCHGKNGEGVRQGTLQLGPALVGRKPGDAFDFNLSQRNEGTKTIGNYWPYATTIFDYVRRAMPYDRPGSLSDSEVYAVTAYLLARNQIIEETAVMDSAGLRRVKMPSVGRFRRDDRETVNRVR